MHSTYQPTNIGLLLPLAYWRLSPLPRLPHQPQVWLVHIMARETRSFAQRLSELTSKAHTKIGTIILVWGSYLLKILSGPVVKVSVMTYQRAMPKCSTLLCPYPFLGYV